jgi:hypothetical protein
MKCTKCDRCGAEGEGRNPEDFHEVPKYEKSSGHADGYYDLCKSCYNEYLTISMSAMNLAKKSITLWINKEILKISETEQAEKTRKDGFIYANGVVKVPAFDENGAPILYEK